MVDAGPVAGSYCRDAVSPGKCPSNNPFGRCMTTGVRKDLPALRQRSVLTPTQENLKRIGGRAALLAGTVVRDAVLRFCLSDFGWRADDRRKARCRGLKCQQIKVHCREGAWIVRAFIGKGVYPVSSLDKLASLLHLHHAVVPSIPSAAGGQPGIRGLSGREQRGDNRQAKDGQQQNG